MATFGSNRRIKQTGVIGPYGIFLILVVNCQFVATSVTWTAPPPAWTQTDSKVIKTVDMQVLLGSTQVPLRWNYSLSAGTVLLSTPFSIDGDEVGAIFSGGITTINNRNDYRTRFAISTSEVATLIINKVTEREEATFRCQLTVVGNTWAYNIRVNVTVAAKLTNVSGDQTVPEGSNMKLFCEATGKPTPNITWTRVPDSNSEALYQPGPTWNFPNISRTASGTYRCTAYNGVGNPVSQEVKVNVIYPAKIVKLPSEYEVAVEQSVSLHCQAEGNPKPTYTWTPCESVCHESTLNTPGVLSDGTFICNVTNAFGSDARNTSVVIAGTLINVTLTIKSESCNDRRYNQSLLWKKLKDTINAIFANKSGYKSTRLTDVRCGSVIVDVELKFNSTVTEREVITILRDAAKNGRFGEFIVDASSIVGTRPEDTSTTTAATTTPTSSSDSTKTVIIVVAVLASVAVLCVVGVAVWYMHKRRKCKRKDTKVHNNGSQEGAPENDQEGVYAQANSGYADVGPRPNPNDRAANPSSVTYDAVKQSVKTSAKKEKKGVVKEKPVVEYAVVDKSKQKKKEKKPKPGELQYAELGEFSKGKRIPNTSTSPATETQYADINQMI